MKFLFKNIIRHPAHFLFLGTGLFIALVFLFIFRFEPYFQRYVVYSTAIFYLLWALFHHYHRGDLHFSVMLEYLIFALLAVLVATWQFF